MKIRSGFVSNSSSSSFLIIGTHLNEEEYEKLCSQCEELDELNIDLYDGWEQRYVVGVAPYTYLEENKLYDAIKEVKNYMLKYLPPEILEGKEFDLIVDSYDC